MKGRNALFSFTYKPGAIKRHICTERTGNEKHIAAKKATFTWVKKASCNPVKIILLPTWPSVAKANG